MARNAQSELLRLANEWLALGDEANSFIVQDDLEQPHMVSSNDRFAAASLQAAAALAHVRRAASST